MHTETLQINKQKNKPDGKNKKKCKNIVMTVGFEPTPVKTSRIRRTTEVEPPEAGAIDRSAKSPVC